LRYAIFTTLALLLTVPQAFASETGGHLPPDVMAAVQRGDPAAELKLGNSYAAATPPDFAQAAGWWQKAADQQNAKAAFNLGQMYHLGQQGGKPDDAQAAKWWQKAGKLGHARAQESLGALYENGSGVKKSYADAATWYEKAANQGSVTAQASLSAVHLQGLHYPEAYFWAAVAVAHGDADAVTMRDRLAKALTPAQLEAANRRVADWKPGADETATTKH
jgi:TPR repeat protein